MILGTDLSQYQSANTEPLPNDRFWIIRVGDGVAVKDSTYNEHLRVAVEHKLRNGPYLFYRPDASPEAQADILMQARRSTIDLPPSLDFESFSGTPREMAIKAQACLRRIRHYNVQRVMVYMSEAMVARIDWGSIPDVLDMIYWWIAKWGGPLRNTYYYGRPVVMHQYLSGHGAGGGDRDIWLKSEMALKTFTFDTPILTPPPPKPDVNGGRLTMGKAYRWLENEWIPRHYAPDMRKHVMDSLTARDAVEIIENFKGF